MAENGVISKKKKKSVRATEGGGENDNGCLNIYEGEKRNINDNIENIGDKQFSESVYIKHVISLCNVDIQ